LGDAPSAQLIQPDQADSIGPVLRAKIIRFRLHPNQIYKRTVPARIEGRIAIVTDVGHGMRWTQMARETNAPSAYGKAKWSWHPDAGVKLAGDLASDGDNKARSPGRAWNKPSTHRAGNAGDLAVPVVTMLMCFFHLHVRLRVLAQAPGIPCALSIEGDCLARTRA
jgi:hypothetical protein